MSTIFRTDALSADAIRPAGAGPATDDEPAATGAAGLTAASEQATRLMGADGAGATRAGRAGQTGVAALDLAYVAAGRFDEEDAGGRVTHYDGRPFDIYRPPIAASNGLVHDPMLAVLREP